MIPILLAAALAAPASLTDMRSHKRVLLLAAPGGDDPNLLAQRKALASWDQEARDRDLAIVTIIGNRVTGTTDTAAALRKRFHLHGGFVAILIGKDGGGKIRSAKPIAADTLAAAIDAMPMRRAGQR